MNKESRLRAENGQLRRELRELHAREQRADFEAKTARLHRMLGQHLSDFDLVPATCPDPLHVTSDGPCTEKPNMLLASCLMTIIEDIADLRIAAAKVPQLTREAAFGTCEGEFDES